MKSIEILTSAKNELSLQLESIANQFNTEVGSGLVETFSEIQFPVDVRFNSRGYRSGYVTITIPAVDGSEYKEIGTVGFSDRYHWVLDESRIETQVTLSYYTTGMDFQTSFEPTRLKVLGELAWFINNNRQRVIDVWNEIRVRYDEIIKPINNEIGEIERSIQQIKETERLTLRERFYSDLNTQSGVTFNKNLFLSVRSGYEPRITNLRVVKFSPSGKTADIEFTGSSGTTYTETIRVKNLDEFFSFYITEITEVLSA